MNAVDPKPSEPSENLPEQILLVEDDVGLQRQMAWALTPYEAVVAGSREEAVALFRERMDASATAARLRRHGFSVACLSAIEIETKPVQPQRSRYDAVIATSDKAFHADGPSDLSSPLYAVGARTGRTAEAHATPHSHICFELQNGGRAPSPRVRGEVALGPNRLHG